MRIKKKGSPDTSKPPQAETERRTSQRKSLHGVTGIIKIEGRAYECHLLNVSGGIGVEVIHPVSFSIGSTVELESTETGTVTGKVVWASENHFGLTTTA